MSYSMYGRPENNKTRNKIKILLGIVIFVGIAAALFTLLRSSEPQTVKEKIEARLSYDESVFAAEKSLIEAAITSQSLAIESDTSISAVTTDSPTEVSKVLGVYVFVTNQYAVRQEITTDELKDANLFVLPDSDMALNSSLEKTLNLPAGSLSSLPSELANITDKQVVIIPYSKLTTDVKLLAFDGEYYLDEFDSGALFREFSVSGEGANGLSSLSFDQLGADDVFKTNITGVTALTREMQSKLKAVKDPLYFSEKIGDFLADADLTHVSNEVSFKEDCPYSSTKFCSPPEFIDTLKASGVDLVELTGNHNNDLGRQLNANSIKQYRELGWATVGGGLNTEDAAKPHIVNQDESKVAFLAYNFADAPGSGALASVDGAGANGFTFEGVEKDIAAAKESSDFVVVNIQYWECYAYPDGYVEYPTCDVPIGEQEASFKKVIDLGADMVVGSSAHQPQTWEFYKGKPIYYGLGNLYFDQSYWPGTERGLVVSSYFVDGELLQNKLTPTVYDDALQTRVMTDSEAEFLLTRLSDAR